MEHDKDMMEHADFVFDIGPGAGRHGGEIVSQGTFEDLKKHNTLTADYLTGRKEIAVPKKRREGNGKFIKLKGATGNNLKKCFCRISFRKNDLCNWSFWKWKIYLNKRNSIPYFKCSYL